MTSSFFTLGNAIRATVLFGLFISVFVLVQSCQKPATGLERYATGTLSKLTVRENPAPSPSLVFETVDGKTTTLADHRGKIVVLNAWATWCPPCLKEMPSLDRLQALRGGEDFEVLTVSIDRSKYDPAKFFADNDIENLDPWHDGTFGLPGKLVLRGYPTTVIYGPAGNELAILEGDAEWDDPLALGLIDYLIESYVEE
jgi:thiol-disulfide isomerase/thioredoxin